MVLGVENDADYNVLFLLGFSTMKASENFANSILTLLKAIGKTAQFFNLFLTSK